MPYFKILFSSLMIICGCSALISAQTQPNTTPTPANSMALSEWKEEFDGTVLDSKNWEQYSLEGGGTVKVSSGKLQTIGASGSRFGIRTTQNFKAEKFVVSAKIASVAAGLSESSGTPMGNAVLTILFDNNGVNRIEWLMTNEGRFEAWLMRDGKSERLDNKNLATKEKSPTLGIARRGEDIFFMLNGEVGLKKQVKNLPSSFRVMLYGFGTSKDEWEMVSIITPQQ